MNDIPSTLGTETSRRRAVAALIAAAQLAAQDLPFGWSWEVTPTRPRESACELSVMISGADMATMEPWAEFLGAPLQTRPFLPGQIKIFIIATYMGVLVEVYNVVNAPPPAPTVQEPQAPGQEWTVPDTSGQPAPPPGQERTGTDAPGQERTVPDPSGRPAADRPRTGVGRIVPPAPPGPVLPDRDPSVGKLVPPANQGVDFGAPDWDARRETFGRPV